jgi:hypothetical protein
MSLCCCSCISRLNMNVDCSKLFLYMFVYGLRESWNVRSVWNKMLHVELSKLAPGSFENYFYNRQNIDSTYGNYILLLHFHGLWCLLFFTVFIYSRMKFKKCFVFLWELWCVSEVTGSKLNGQGSVSGWSIELCSLPHRIHCGFYSMGTRDTFPKEKVSIVVMLSFPVKYQGQKMCLPAW